MKIKPLAFIFLALLSFTSCEEDKTLKVTKMDSFPADIMGCSCYFAENEADFKAQKYIYVDSYERNPAYISIDGKLVAVNAEKSETKGYSIILEIDQKIQLDQELYHKEGTITIVHESGAVTTRPIYGECGC
tara:strand:+ start:113 stop:508 length:396 start_codon:yes stop_codon:yes gene_type:complete